MIESLVKFFFLFKLLLSKNKNELKLKELSYKLTAFVVVPFSSTV